MITTDRLTIRAVEPTDADFMYDVDNDASAWRYSDTVAPLSRRMLRDYALAYDADPFASGQLRLILAKKDSGEPLGIIDLYEVSAIHRHCFAGIYICPKFRRNGYAQEALDAVGRYAGSVLLLHKIAARIEKGNLASQSLFYKAGFELEAEIKDWINTPDGFTDMLILTKKL